MWTIFKVFIELVTILLLFPALVFWTQGIWDPSSPTMDQTCPPCVGRFNHWTARKVLTFFFFLMLLSLNTEQLTLWQHWLWEQRMRLPYLLQPPLRQHRESAWKICANKDQARGWIQALGLPFPPYTQPRPPPLPPLRNRRKYNLSDLPKSLYSIACLPQAAGTFFQTPQACQAANVPCVVCGPFSKAPYAMSAGQSGNPQM